MIRNISAHSKPLWFSVMCQDTPSFHPSPGWRQCHHLWFHSLWRQTREWRRGEWWTASHPYQACLHLDPLVFLKKQNSRLLSDSPKTYPISFHLNYTNFKLHWYPFQNNRCTGSTTGFKKETKIHKENVCVPCWMTMESRRNFISALSTILSSTVFSVMKRKTRTCFCWPILWARSWNTKVRLVKLQVSEITSYCHAEVVVCIHCSFRCFKVVVCKLRTANHGLKVDLRIPVWVVEDDYISCGKVDTQPTSSGTQHEDEFTAVKLIVCIDGDLKTQRYM